LYPPLEDVRSRELDDGQVADRVAPFCPSGLMAGSTSTISPVFVMCRSMGLPMTWRDANER
jgi:hypothetical protein